VIEYTVQVSKDKTEWRLNGKRHREDGPAIEWANGDKEWYLNGKYHREDGPAIEGVDGTKMWWLNGLLHREDGPAIERPNGDKEWWLNDKLISEEKFNPKTQTKELTVTQLEELLGYKIKVVGE